MNKRNHPYKPLRIVLHTSVLLAMVLLAQGCATLNKDECKVADWRLIGYQDGVAGKSGSAIGTYRKDCAEYAVVPDLDAYQAGRAEGLEEYCKADNGYRLGHSGKGYATVCPSGLEPGFRAAYNQGREIYIARSVVKRTREQMQQLEYDLSDLENEKQHKLADLISEGLSGDQRVMILYDLNELEKDKDAIREELAMLHQELDDQLANLEGLSRHAAR
ncbi:MAG: DUF2799 domain-containing protein [Gammaproteobacteria bacterium]